MSVNISSGEGAAGTLTGVACELTRVAAGEGAGTLIGSGNGADSDAGTPADIAIAPADVVLGSVMDT
jgi:hypothetical protein